MRTRMLDWNDLRYCLALSRAGSLTAAARALRVTQPTVGRRIKAMENALGTILFTRHPTGFVPTDAGRAVVAQATLMEGAALAVEHVASGHDVGVAGTVTLTASEWLVERILAPGLAPFMARHPDVEVELVADARWLSLVRRDVDLALRPARFEHHEIVQREVVELQFALFASTAYVEDHGYPDFADGCAGHRLLMMDDRGGAVADHAWLAEVAPAARIVARCNGRLALAAMAAAGAGVACLPCWVGDAMPELRRVPSPDLPRRSLRIGYHRDARNVPRLRHLIDFLVRLLEPRLGDERLVSA